MSNQKVDVYMKENDTAPPIEAQFEDDNGDPVDISSNNSVTFKLHDDNELIIDAAAVVTDGPNGKVEYNWQDGDLDEEGEYKAEFELEYSDGTVETFPNTDYILVKVIEDLDSL